MTKYVPYLFVIVFLSSCTNLFYFPMKEQVMVPSDVGMNFRDVWIENEGQPRLHAWFFPVTNPIATVLQLHGNAENISTHLASTYWIPSKHIQLLILDYRGYGLSDGNATIDGVHEDVARTIRYLQTMPDVDKTKLILLGQSIGGTTALYMASRPEFADTFKAVIAESAFSSYRLVAREKLASFWLTYLFQYPLQFLVSDSYSPALQVDALRHQKLLMLHGASDQIVLPHHSDDLCRAIGPTCELWTYPAGHIQAFQNEEMRLKFVKFVSDAVN